jgi:hypothetical protein
LKSVFYCDIPMQQFITLLSAHVFLNLRISFNGISVQVNLESIEIIKTTPSGISARVSKMLVSGWYNIFFSTGLTVGYHILCFQKYYESDILLNVFENIVIIDTI